MMENTLAFAIELFENTTRSRVHTIRLLEGGTANDIYFINLSYVLRIRKENKTDAEFYEPPQELAILKKASSLITPDLMAYDPTNGNMLTRYVRPGEMKDEKDATFRLYRSLMSSLKILHAIDMGKENISPFMANARFLSYKIASETSFDEHYENRIVQEALLAMGRYPTVICHNDLHKGNFLFDPVSDSVKLLDFEFASLNSEIFDVASVFSENNIEGRLKERLTLAYFGANNVTNQLNEDIDWVVAFQDLLWYYWAMARYKETLSQSFLDIAKEKMGRIRRRMRSGQKKN